MDDERPTTLRIAVDGAPGAGKTTTTRALGERLGQPVLTPEEDEDGRTQLFDWLHYTGGRHRGQAIRTQVIAVPGHRPALRQTIIELADVVLFVADSTPEGIFTSAEAFRDLQAIRSSMALPPGLVIQANKRDADDAHEVDDVRVLFEVDDEVQVVETVAATGDGVQQAFVYAVRSGLSRLDLDPAGTAIDGDLTPDGLARLLRGDQPTETAETAESAQPVAPVVAVEAVAPEDVFEIVEADDDANPFAHLPPPPPGPQAPAAPPAAKARWRRRKDSTAGTAP